MNQITFLLIYIDKPVYIDSGEHKGKLTKIVRIDLENMKGISKSGLEFSLYSLKPILRTLDDMTDQEGFLIYRTYWGKEEAIESMDEDSVTLTTPKKEHALRIFNGPDYTTCDFEEWARLFPVLIELSFDAFNGLEKGWAINKNEIK